MNSIFKPIVATFANLAASTPYTYRVTLHSFVENDEVEVYRGRCISDADGNLAVRIDTVCRDYAYRHPRVWQQDRQGYVPAALASLTTPRTPDDYIITNAIVTVYDAGGNEVANYTDNPMWAGWLPEWMKGELIWFTGQKADLTLLGNGIVPHLPPVATTKMWCDLVLQWFDASDITLTDGVTTISIPTSSEGCYDVAFTLQDLFDTLADTEIDGGESDSTPDGEIDGGDSDDTPDGEVDGGDSTEEYTVTAGIKLYVESMKVAEVDACASPYYVAWVLPSGGWMCWGFDGNTTQSANPTVTTIRDTMDADRVTGMDVQAIFSLFSGFLTRDEYNLLTTLAFAREVYVYDTRNDKGVWCTVDSRTIPTAGNVRWRNEPLNITLKEITHSEI